MELGSVCTALSLNLRALNLARKRATAACQCAASDEGELRKASVVWSGLLTSSVEWGEQGEVSALSNSWETVSVLRLKGGPSRRSRRRPEEQQ